MNSTPINISETIKTVLNDLAEFCYLMGSAETEKFNTDSDVDVAVFWKKDISEDQKNNCHIVFEEKFKRDVDLVSLNKIDVIFARQVLETGRLLFCHSKGFHLNWTMEQMSIYPDFKFSRQIIEKNILNRKKHV